MKRREVNFEVGDLVLAHWRKERFLKGKYNKLKFKKIGPCKIWRKFSANAYEIELPPDVGISPIFNIVDLYKYQVESIEVEPEDIEESRVDWVKQLPTKETLQPKKILDRKVYKKTRNQEYYQYLVKWKDHPVADATWVTEATLHNINSSVEELMDRSP